MRQQLVLVTAPAAEPLSAAEAKARLGIGSELSDTVVDALIKGARQSIDGAEGWLGRALVTQTWDLILDAFPADEIPLPLPPVQSVTSITYLDAAGSSQTVDPADYELVKGAPARVRPDYDASWPSARGCRGEVTVRFVAGYGAAEDVPEPIRNAIALQVAHLRSLMAQNLFLRSEVVEGVGSFDYFVSEAAGRALGAAADALLAPYRVWL